MSYVKWDGKALPPAIKAHLLLLLLPVLSYFVYIPYSWNVVLYAAVSVYAGSWRSVQEEPPEETMTHHEAMKFPIVGSCVLLSLFLMFKFLPKWLVNVVLSSYITVIGSMAVHHVAAPVANHFCPRKLSSRVIKLPTIPAIPYLLEEPLTLEYTLPELLLWAPSVGVGVWYSITKNWMANNWLGLCFSLVGIENVALGSVQTAVILLSGLFVYDVFWVFCTPVMVDVAKNFEAPIKLLFPRTAMINWGALLSGGGASAAAAAAKRNFAMLGLGDIVIPGFWLALLLRYDVGQGFRTSYFQSVFWAYVAGLGTTIAVMNHFKKAQPALLYIVPAILAVPAVHAALRGEVGRLWAWHEDDTLTAAQKERKQARAAAAVAPAAKQAAEAADGDDKKAQ